VRKLPAERLRETAVERERGPSSRRKGNRGKRYSGERRVRLKCFRGGGVASAPKRKRGVLYWDKEKRWSGSKGGYSGSAAM